MGMTEYKLARTMISARQSKATFAGSRSEQIIAKAESVLGVKYPTIFRQFLHDYGAGNFGQAEFYGIIDEDWVDSSVPDGVWYTLNERMQSQLPKELIVIGVTGTGELYVIDAREASGPVDVVDPGVGYASRERIASDFGTFFWQQVQQAGNGTTPQRSRERD